MRVQVEQFDIHTPALTIRESFSFSASLRLMDVNVEQREEFVDEVCPACLLTFPHCPLNRHHAFFFAPLSMLIYYLEGHWHTESFLLVPDTCPSSC